MFLSTKLRKDLPSDCEEVARLRLQMSNYLLSELVEQKVLERDEDENVVRKGERFTEVRDDIEKSTECPTTYGERI